MSHRLPASNSDTSCFQAPPTGLAHSADRGPALFRKLIKRLNLYTGRHAVAELGEALCYKLEGRGFDSQ
jgi:hypothetical protein